MTEGRMFQQTNQPDTIREPEKQFGPTGTLRIPEKVPEESGLYKRESLPQIFTPPKSREQVLEPKVVINDQTRLEELRGGMVEVVPVVEQKFDLEEIETNLGRVQMAIKEAQDAAARAQTPEQRGMAMKKLTELKREKEALDAQLPFAKKDELKSAEADYQLMVARYQELVTKLTKTPDEELEFKTLAEKLPIEKAHLDQLKQTMAFKKEKGLSTADKKQSFGQKVSGWFKGLFGNK